MFILLFYRCFFLLLTTKSEERLEERALPTHCTRIFFHDRYPSIIVPSSYVFSHLRLCPLTSSNTKQLFFAPMNIGRVQLPTRAGRNLLSLLRHFSMSVSSLVLFATLALVLSNTTYYVAEAALLARSFHGAAHRETMNLARRAGGLDSGVFVFYPLIIIRRESEKA
ncbi:hypothetical protein BC835DRAFT_386602 [Cytidiella melzeri]|nr:hypothetical protein BC835DRAFT_386602 [Cytidiella melzeri]